MDATLSAPEFGERPAGKGKVTLFSGAHEPVLELKDAFGRTVRVPFHDAGPGRTDAERRWVAEPSLAARGTWSFRVKLDKGVFDAPLQSRYYQTALRTLWIQDKQLFAYEPPPYVSPSRVIKVEAFKGSLPTRSLYIYLPRGYEESAEKHYPVIYMHDGQNVFETFVEDSYAGSWRADEVADVTVGCGQMLECIIVGVSNGGVHRLTEYLPPYSSFALKSSKIKPRTLTKKAVKTRSQPITGRADEVFAYYRDEVAPYLKTNYRVLEGRDHTATCGSSMGGIFSAYIAWEQPDFARSHALMSSSFWITRGEDGKPEMVERFRSGEPRDVRIWLDSGTGDPDSDSDDNMASTERAYDALRANGYAEGANFQYFVDEGAIHHESAWAARLGKVFAFLMPAETS